MKIVLLLLSPKMKLAILLLPKMKLAILLLLLPKNELGPPPASAQDVVLAAAAKVGSPPAAV